MAIKVRIDGRPGDRISSSDRALQFGDGVFETLAMQSGRALLWDEHMARLHDGCRRLGITPPAEPDLRHDADCLGEGGATAILKIIISRGQGGRGYRPPVAAACTRIAAVYPWPDDIIDLREQGVALMICNTRLAGNPALAGIKHLNRLEQVMASRELVACDATEGLMLDMEDRLIEGTRSNLFLVIDGVVHTPTLDRCGVCGVMRGQILAGAGTLGIQTRVRDISVSELDEAEEVFISNSLIGIWPVRRVAGRVLTGFGLATRLLDYLRGSARVVCP